MPHCPLRRFTPVRRRTLGAVLAAAWALTLAVPAQAATRSVKYVPVYVPLVVIDCPKLNLNPFKPRPKDAGYLPAIGHAQLRWAEPAPQPRAIEPPPVVLYNPPAQSEKPAAEEPSPTPATEPAATEPPAAETPSTPKPVRRESPLRAEDFLPFFEGPGELSGARGDIDGSTFVPARPVLPESRADFRQK